MLIFQGVSFTAIFFSNQGFIFGLTGEPAAHLTAQWLRQQIDRASETAKRRGPPQNWGCEDDFPTQMGYIASFVECRSWKLVNKLKVTFQEREGIRLLESLS